MGKYSDAELHYKKILELKPDDALTHYNLGLTMLKTGKYDDAEKYFIDALRLDPQNFEACNYLGSIMGRKRELDRAVEYYRKSLQIDGGQVMILNNVAWIGATFEDPWPGCAEEAMDMARLACELSKFQQPVTLDTLAAACAAAGKFDDAIEYAQKAIGLAETVGNNQLAEQIKGRLSLYKNHKPYLDPDRIEWQGGR
jgi:Tfp pilus assembly protein PilF